METLRENLPRVPLLVNLGWGLIRDSRVPLRLKAGLLGVLAYVDLLRVCRWEETHKNRVTVIRAVERELERRERLPEAQPATVD